MEGGIGITVEAAGERMKMVGESRGQRWCSVEEKDGKMLEMVA